MKDQIRSRAYCWYIGWWLLRCELNKSLTFMDPCIVVCESVETTNKMHPCNRIYYSKIHWRLDMFRAAYRSSSGAPNCICSLWFIYPCGHRPVTCIYSLELLMMRGMPLETCRAFNTWWNNKFYCKVASCWLFLLIHTTKHGSMNINL
jgi:hypothetical protein